MEREIDLDREEEMIILAYKESMVKFNNAGYKGIVKTQMHDKIVQEYLEQKMNLARKRLRLAKEKEEHKW